MDNVMLEDDEIAVRPEVMAFAVAMERVMRTHDHDYGDSYKTMDTGDLLNALLTIHRRAVHIDEALVGGCAPKTITNLAARIGCYAMFFHYHYRRDRRPPEGKNAGSTD